MLNLTTCARRKERCQEWFLPFLDKGANTIKSTFSHSPGKVKEKGFTGRCSNIWIFKFFGIQKLFSGTDEKPKVVSCRTGLGKADDAND